MSATRMTLSDARRRPARCRGSMLLEVLLALAILTLGMSTVGIQINGAFRLELEAAEQFRRSSLIESMVAQIEGLVAQAQMGAQEEGEPVTPERDIEIEGEFGLRFPGYAYRIFVEPMEDIEGLNQVTVELLTADFDPDTGELLDEPVRVYVARTLRASPVQINLEDLGVTLRPDQRDMLAGGGLLDDDGNLNLQALLAMDPAALLELLPMLISAFGGGQLAQMMGGMSPEQLLEMLQEQQRGSAGEDQTDRSGGTDAADAGDYDLDENPPSFEDVDQGTGLTQEQFEWMLEQLRKKQQENR